MSSLPIAAVVDHLATPDPVVVAGGEDALGLLAVLASVPDPRAARGVRHRFRAVLAIAVCAVLAGARSFAAIAEWAADADAAALAALGCAGRRPHESTIRRVLQSIDGDALDVVIGAWLAQRTARVSPRRVIAVDGKSVRGAIGEHGRARHLMAALDHSSAVVLGQVDVDGKTNEIPMFAPLLDRIELAGAVVTADALHAQREHADYLVAQRGAHYLLTVKGNQPKLNAQLRALPWKQVPPGHTERDRGHARAETRSVKVVTVQAGLLFPHAAQAIQITRRTRPLTGAKWRTVTAYAVTSLTAAQAQPEQLAGWVRGHWAIENSLHWVRDVTYGEDASQARTANGPRVMAALRNLAISTHRLAGAVNIAAALRHTARNTSRALALLGVP